MSDFDLRQQHIETQYVAEQIHFYPPPAASTSHPAMLWTVPYPRNPLFTGREEVLHLLHGRLTNAKTTALIQAITGLGGIGKTQTVLEYAYQY